jgi:hypothetical protein
VLAGGVGHALELAAQRIDDLGLAEALEVRETVALVAREAHVGRERQRAPRDRRALDGAAEEERRGRGRVDRLAVDVVLARDLGAHLELRLAELRDAERGAGDVPALLVPALELDRVAAGRRVLGQLQLERERAEVVDLDALVVDELLAAGAVDRDPEVGLRPRQLVERVEVAAHDALVEHRLARPVDRAVGVDVADELALPLDRHAELPRRRAVRPVGVGDAEAAAVIEQHEPVAVPAVARDRLSDIEAREARVVGGGHDAAALLARPARLERDAAQRLAALVVERPHQQLVVGKLRDEGGVDHAEQHDRPLRAGFPDEPVVALRERLAVLGQPDRRVVDDVARALDLGAPAAQRPAAGSPRRVLARWRAVLEVALGLPRGEPVERERDRGDVRRLHVDDRLAVRGERRAPRGQREQHLRGERAGAERERERLDRQPLAVARPGGERDRVVGLRLEADRDVERTVVVARLQQQIVVVDAADRDPALERIEVERVVVGDAHPVATGVALAVARTRVLDPGRVRGAEVHAARHARRAARGAPHAGRHKQLVAAAELEHPVRVEGDHRVALAPAEGAVDGVAADSAQLDVGLDRGARHRLVEGQREVAGARHEQRVVGRLGRDQRGLNRREAPRKVRGQLLVGGRGEPGADPRAVLGGGRQLIRAEAIDRGVEPLAAAANRRVERDDLGVLDRGEDRERGHRAAELHEDLRLDRHLLVAVGGDHLIDAQAALDLEALLDRCTEPDRGVVDANGVRLAAREAGFRRLEQQPPVAEPAERTLDVGLDADEAFGRRHALRLREVDLHRPEPGRVAALGRDVDLRPGRQIEVEHEPVARTIRPRRPIAVRRAVAVGRLDTVPTVRSVAAEARERRPAEQRHDHHHERSGTGTDDDSPPPRHAGELRAYRPRTSDEGVAQAAHWACTSKRVLAETVRPSERRATTFSSCAPSASVQRTSGSAPEVAPTASPSIANSTASAPAGTDARSSIACVSSSGAR